MKGTFGQNNVRLLYYRYKDSSYYSMLIIGGIIAVCVALIFFVIIPQIQSLFPLQQEISATQARIKVLNKNIAYMGSLDKDELDSQFKTAVNALPTERDFANIIDSVAHAATKSTVTLEDYSFYVGNVASLSATEAQTSALQNGLVTTTLSLSFRGSVDNIKDFLQIVRESLPLSHVREVEETQNETTLNIFFLQKPLPPMSLGSDEVVTPLSNEKKLLLNMLSEWKASASAEVPPIISSSSGSLNLPLF